MFLAAHAAPPPPIFWTGGARRLPEIARRAAADRNCPARRRRHNDVGAQLYARLLQLQMNKTINSFGRRKNINSLLLYINKARSHMSSISGPLYIERSYISIGDTFAYAIYKSEALHVYKVKLYKHRRGMWWRLG